jgi:predicted transposase/invertase (TIGR01784 family)
MKLFYQSRLYRELKRLARENSAQGKPLSIMDDVIFKAVFSSDTEDSSEALRHLLTACTRRDVSSVRVVNGELPPAYLGAKSPRLDIHVTFNDGEAADLEMQVGQSDDDLKPRAAFYSAMLLSGQSKKGEPYKQLKRVYQIFFLNCALFPQGGKVPRRYFYMEEEERDRLTDVTEIIFYELPKLGRKLEDVLSGRAGVESLSDEEKWCIYLRYRYEGYARPLIEELCGEGKGIMRAERALQKVDRDYIRYARGMAEMKNRIDRAFAVKNAMKEARQIVYAEAQAKGVKKGLEKGFKKGRTEGIAEGRTEGIAKGRAEGKAEANMETARKMKKAGRPLSEIMEFTGLPIEDIEKL